MTAPEGIPVSRADGTGAAINAALAKAQARFHNIGKDRDVEVKSEKGRYTFRYATLAAMWDVIRAPLAEAGLAVVQLPTIDLVKGVIDVETQLLHASGESIVGHFMLPLADKAPQKVGSVVSYARRYALASMLGLASEDETDVDDDSRTPARQAESQQAPRPQASPPAAKAAGPSALQVRTMFVEADSEAALKKAAAVASKNKARFTADEYRGLLAAYKQREAELKGEAS